MATFYLNHEAELYHYGVKGMKWGKHKYADDYVPPLWKKKAKRAHANAVSKRVAERKGREAALAEQERQSKKQALEERSERVKGQLESVNNVSRQSKVKNQLARYDSKPFVKENIAPGHREKVARAHANAVSQRVAERKGREAALAEQEKARARRKKKEQLNYKKNRSYTTQYRR